MPKEEKESSSSKKQNKIVLDLFGSEILERKASKFGTGAHILIPKEHLGKKIKIIIEDDNEK
jgi:putative transposon-encoded protein